MSKSLSRENVCKYLVDDLRWVTRSGTPIFLYEGQSSRPSVYSFITTVTVTTFFTHSFPESGEKRVDSTCKITLNINFRRKRVETVSPNKSK